MAPAPPGPSQHRNGKQLSVRTTDGGTAHSVGIEASAGWTSEEGGSQPRPDDVPPNRKARRVAAARARQGRP